MKMKYSILIISLVAVLFAQENVEREVVQATKQVIAALASGDVEQISSLLVPEVVVEYKKDDEIKGLIDKLILNEITAVDYLRKISGVNLYKMTQNFEGKSWKLSQALEWDKNIYPDKTLYKEKTQDYYFIKIKFMVGENNLETGEVVLMERVVEMDYIFINGEVKLFGFIL